MEAAGQSLPGVIVVAEPALYDLLVAQPVSWRVQERQESVARMWEGLSSGALDSYSRIVVFSDALAEGEPAEADERAQTAWATAAMAGAGARVFVAVWRPEQVAELDRQIVEAAAAQGLDASRLDYFPLPVVESARTVLDTLRQVLGSDVSFPPDWAGDVEAPLRRRSLPAGLPLQPPARPLAGLPLTPPGRPATADPPDAQVPDQQVPDQVDVPEPDAERRYGEDAYMQPSYAEPSYAEPSPVDAFDDRGQGADVVPVEALAYDDVAVGTDAAAAPESTEAATDAEPAASPEPLAERGVIADEGWLRPGLPPLVSRGPVEEDPALRAAQGSTQLLDRPVPDGQVTLTVTSSKGGSGKTTVSVLLAATIARASTQAGRPLSVVVVDLDTYHGQVSSLVGTFMPTALNIRVQPLWDEDRIRQNLVYVPTLGIETLLAPIRPRTADILDPDFYRTVIRSLKRMYDVIVIDTGNHYLSPLVADVALAESDEVLFVTTLAATAVQGMARALHELTAPPAESGLGVPRAQIGIVVNQAATDVGLDGDAILTAGLGVPIVGVVPLATKDVLTATNSSRMEALLDHPLLGPAYHDLARACLPSRALAHWQVPSASEQSVPPATESTGLQEAAAGGGERRGLFRR